MCWAQECFIQHPSRVSRQIKRVCQAEITHAVYAAYDLADDDTAGRRAEWSIKYSFTTTADYKCDSGSMRSCRMRTISRPVPRMRKKIT
jgi:hypothetical protein